MGRTERSTEAIGDVRVMGVGIPAQGAYQSHFRWALIKIFISRFASLKYVIFEEKNQ